MEGLTGVVLDEMETSLQGNSVCVPLEGNETSSSRSEDASPSPSDATLTAEEEPVRLADVLERSDADSTLFLIAKPGGGNGDRLLDRQYVSL